MTTKFSESIIMLRLVEMYDVHVDNIIISNLIETKNNPKYLIGYLDEVIRLLLLILPKMNGYVKNFKDKNSKFISLHIDDDKLLEKYKKYKRLD